MFKYDILIRHRVKFHIHVGMHTRVSDMLYINLFSAGRIIT